MTSSLLAPPDVGVGSRLGKYEIIKRLATGGMAEIFLARVSGLPGFQKMVVIKRILPQLATKTDFVEVFLDEARIAATLQHPNVVQMYDVGVVDGNYFIAMEYLHGEDVRSLTRSLHRQDGDATVLWSTRSTLLANVISWYPPSCGTCVNA